MKKLALVGLLVLVLSLLVVGTALAQPRQANKVWICHSTGSETNPYVKLHIAWQAWVNAHESGQGAHSGDYILAHPDDECGGTNGGDHENKVWICHSTGSETNPYVKLHIAWQAWVNAHESGQGAHSGDYILDHPDDECGTPPGDDDITTTDDDDDGGTPRVYVLQYCVDGQRVFLQSQTAGDLTPIKDEDPCPALPALGPVEAVAPAAGGILPSPVFFGAVGMGLLGALRLAWALIKRS